MLERWKIVLSSSSFGPLQRVVCFFRWRPRQPGTSATTSPPTCWAAAGGINWQGAGQREGSLPFRILNIGSPSTEKKFNKTREKLEAACLQASEVEYFCHVSPGLRGCYSVTLTTSECVSISRARGVPLTAVQARRLSAFLPGTQQMLLSFHGGGRPSASRRERGPAPSRPALVSTGMTRLSPGVCPRTLRGRRRLGRGSPATKFPSRKTFFIENGHLPFFIVLYACLKSCVFIIHP